MLKLPLPYVSKTAIAVFALLALTLQTLIHASGIQVSLAQSSSGATGSTPINLTTDGDLDWAAWAGGDASPAQTMAGGAGFVGLTAIGSTTFESGDYYGQNLYSWSNGTPTGSGNSNLAGKASVANNGNGVRLTVDVVSPGTYQLKFYASTYDLNLHATATLVGSGLSSTASGSYVGDPVQKYEYTVDFTTDGAETLTLDMVKNGGNNAIYAQEAFSLKAVDVTPVPNLNIEPSFSYTNDSTAETFQIPYSNNGQEPLTVSGVTVGGTDAAYFTVASYDTSLAAGANGNIALDFNPGAGDKLYDATLTIASNDPDSPNTLVTISVNSGNVVSGCVVDLFIVAGQSNANGLGERANFLSSTQAGPHDVKFYCSWHTNGNDAESTQNYSDWADQTEAGYTRAYFYDDRFGNGGVLGGDTDGGAPGPSSWFGPEVGFAARALELNLTGGNQLGIIKYAVDGSSLNTSTDTTGVSDWDLSATGYKQGDCWRGFKLALADAVAKLEADGITPNFKGMIWWQGEGGTSTDGLNAFIAAVRNHLATDYGLENSADFPVVITTGGQMVGGSNLESGVAGVDDDVTFVNADPYGQQYQVHVGKSNEGSADWTGNGVNDMYDIGEAYAEAFATIVEPTGFISDCSGSSGGTAEPAPGGGYYVDVFMATGQSNAFYPNDQGEENYYGLGRGVEDVIVASGLFSKPTVVKQGAPGWAIGGWYGEWIPGPNRNYQQQFFGEWDYGSGPVTATLEAKFNEIIAAGDTPRFRGLFWFQGESDGYGPYANNNDPAQATSQATYELRWNGILETLDADLQAIGVDHTHYKFVVNTVAESGPEINNILNYIATQGTYSAKGTIYDAINSPHHGNNDVVDSYGDLHDYDHFAVGQANAQLFLDTFPIVSSGYTITFVNVDGSVTTQTVAEGVIPTPPDPINTDTRVFTAWSPTIVPATADATYTALYGPANGEWVDVFIATGQSNAWGPADDGLWFDSGSNHATYEFGQGVASVLESSDQFSNPVVVFEGAPGQAIAAWWWDGDETIEYNAPNTLYFQQFFDANNPGVATLDAKFAEIVAAGNTPRFRGLFWFQGENDGGYNGTSTPNPATPDATYKVRWNGFIDQIAADVGGSDFNFVMNTVGMVDPAINDTFASITTLDSRGVLFDAQVEPYRDFVDGAPNNDVHGYDHFAVGAANAQLFLDTFYSDQPAPSTYTITFINVDDSVTTQTVNEGEVATPPAGVDTADRTFTGWPTIQPAYADAIYTAEYTQNGGGGEIVDLFIATGQSNAYWPLTEDRTAGTYQFGHGVQDELIASGRFSNPTVVIDGQPGMEIAHWYKDGLPQWLYEKQFFGTYQGVTAALEAKIAEIIAAGNTPRFRGVFWFQGEADGDGVDTGVSTPDAIYIERWNGMLNELATDISSSDFRFVVNTVGNSGTRINNVLTSIANNDSRGAIFNTQVTPYRTNFQDIHGYDHYLVGQANVQLYIASFVDGTPAPSYTLTFVNVDDSVTTQTVLEGVVAIPPEGVNTAERTFTAWPTIAPASADATYTALYTVNDGSSSVSVSLAQSVSGGQGSTAIDLTAEGDLDWGAWNGELTDPGETMAGGAGFISLSAIGATTFDGGTFNGQNSYSWTNGTPTASGSTTLAGNASIAAQGDGVRLTVDVAAAGTYQLKFYTTTYDVNLRATATLASSGLSDTVAGTYNASSTEKYEYTIDFSTGGADTLTLDLTKSDGANAIFAYEAFSLAAISVEEEVQGLGKIICIGDSLTEASATRPAGDGNWSWRYAFWKHLVDNNVAHEFVGTSSYNYDPTNEQAVSVYPDYNGQSFVNRHEGYWGLGAEHLANMAPSFLSTLQGQDETPDTAVVFLGGNDIGHDNSVTAETVRDRIKTIVDNLQGDLGSSGNPNIRVLIVSILPRFNLDANGDYTVPKTENTHYEATNSLLVTLAADETTASSEVTYLDLATTFNTASDVYYDGVHPNGAGEQLEADAIFAALVTVPPTTYTITFINVDDSVTTQVVNEGEVATPPAGVNTAERTFTGWPTIEPATADATYTALYTTNDLASISVSLAQSVNGGQASTSIDLTADGDLDWGAWNGELTVPGETMDAGSGFTSLSALGATTFDGGSFYSQNLYNWTNGTPTAVGNTSFAGNASIPTQGDGVRLTIHVAAAGSYQLKFYTKTHDVNLDATASLSSGGVSDTVSGSYVSGSTEKYAYTVEFTTLGADTLTLDLVKSGGANAIFAYEAFSLKSVGGEPGTTYTITFINVDDSVTTQTVNEGEVATPPAGVNTETRTFTGWPTIEPATADATYTALYDVVTTSYTITFINVDGSQTTQTVDEGEVAVPPAGVNDGDKLFTSWPTIEPAMADATYTANYTVDVGPVDISWDGDAGDGLWATAANWSGDVLPADGNAIAIANGHTVDIPGNDWSLPAGITVHVAGDSQITNSAAAARLYGAMTFNFAAGSGMSGAYIDLYDGTLNFEDGATFTPNNIQHRGTTTYGFTLSSTGFTTLRPGALYDAGNEDWSNVTFNVDVSNYDITNGLIVELIDYSSHAAVYDGSFIPVVNLTAGDSGLTGTLSFDTVNSKVIYTFDTTYEITFINVDGSETTQTVDQGEVAVPPAGVNDGDKLFTGWPTIEPATADATYVANYTVDVGPVDISWDGDAGDGLWTSAANWSGDVLPADGDVIAVANGGTIDMPANDWSLPTGITVNVAGASQITNSVAAARLYGAMTFNFAAGSGLSGAYIDLEHGTLNFEDGATFTPNNIQHRGTTAYGITLSSTGFATLTPGALYNGVDEDWSNVTFNLDLSNYDTANGLVVELIDYASHVAAYDSNFTPSVNITDSGNRTGVLSFDTATSKVLFTFDTYYTITFINVDGTQTTQSVIEGEVAVPPVGVDSGSRYFTGWPTIVPATADATYTASYLELAAPADVSWSGGGVDNLWTTAANWSGGVLPADNEVIVITNGQTIDIPANDWSLPTGITVHVDGNSQITNTAAAARLYGAMTFNFYAGSGLSGAWIDLQDGTLNFEDGATFTATNIQHRGTTTYGLTLSESGFTTLTPGALHSGVDEDWSAVTFNVDLTDYDPANGLSLVLIDYSSHGAAYDASFNPVVNMIHAEGRMSGILNFDTTNSQMILTIDYFVSADGNTSNYVLSPEGFITIDEGHLTSGGRTWADLTYTIDISSYSTAEPVSIVLTDYSSHDPEFDGPFNPTVNITAGDSGLAASLSFDPVTSQLILDLNPLLAWDGEGADDSWLTASNWEGDALPQVGDWLLVGGGAAVVDAQNDFTYLQIEAGAAVTFGDEYLDSNYIVVDGSLDKSGVFRLQSSVFELRGSLGSAITFLDTNSATIDFYDGAAFANSAMSFEHKGTNTFGYILSASGFATIQAGTLWGPGWIAVTYDIDISEYDLNNGSTIVLMDCSGHAAAYDDAFAPAAVNIYAGDSGLDATLSFDTATSSLVLTVFAAN